MAAAALRRGGERIANPKSQVPASANGFPVWTWPVRGPGLELAGGGLQFAV